MNLIEQSIKNCHMTHKYENPGIENGMCAGLRMLCGEGEPCEECKECRLYYGYADEHDIRKTNADRIKAMSDEKLAEFLSEVKGDGIYCKDGMKYPVLQEVWDYWLHLEAEE